MKLLPRNKRKWMLLILPVEITLNMIAYRVFEAHSLAGWWSLA